MTDSNQKKRPDRTAKKPPSITEQVRSFFHRERVDRGCGVHHPSLHRSNIEPIDELLGPAEKEVEDKD